MHHDDATRKIRKGNTTLQSIHQWPMVFLVQHFGLRRRVCVCLVGLQTSRAEDQEITLKKTLLWNAGRILWEAFFRNSATIIVLLNKKAIEGMGITMIE
ncbi:hypothetical protein T01_13902 [Trichinella spiralis]|uniref:Uncharacterized protein n=1 Tax=Trichinella spiralis TaxID=6334 RepID=A0A0V1AWJ8_TRISP|nr:hypothetical protein T01_13902 [Trichinella spiralis]